EKINHLRRCMNWLNYHHLYYFWATARLGSMAKAAEELKLARPTISAQISNLEHQLGEELFEKSGRSVVMTQFGREIFAYADEIFGIGLKLKDFVNRKPSERPTQLTIGISDVLPKLIAYRLMSPLLSANQNVQLSC